MGWSIGFDPHWNRWIGYGVPAICDHPGCGERIDRGLGYVCGGEPFGGDRGCGLFFCSKHLTGVSVQLCERCYPRRRKPFTPTPDTYTWIHHMHTDPSWEKWRKEQEAAKTKAMKESDTP